MGPDRPVDMVPLVQVASPFHARLLAARLGAEGFLWELRGAVDGPYPLGPVTVLVDRPDVECASELLRADHELALDDGDVLLDEDPAVAEPADGDGGTVAVTTRHTVRTRRRLVLAGAALGGAGLVAARVVSVSGAG